VPEPLAEGYKVYTIGLDQILTIFHDETDYNLLVWQKSKIFT
jgi:hypothetical protein